MSEDEINKTIGEFMGLKVEYRKDYLKLNGEKVLGVWAGQNYESVRYTKSIDALVPVTEKLGILWVKLQRSVSGYYCETNKTTFYEDDNEDSPSMALATACAEVIKEMK